MLRLLLRFLPTRQPDLICPGCHNVGSLRHHISLVALPVGPFALTSDRRPNTGTADVYACTTPDCTFETTTLPVVKL